MPGNQPLKWSLIGVGTAGRARARVILDDPRCALVAVWRGRYAAELGVPVAATLEEAIDAAEVVAVASPTEVHPEQVEAALDRGRHVVVEFPLAPTRDRAAALFDRARAAGRVLHVEHIELLDAPSATLGAHIRAPTVTEVEVSFEGPGDGAESAHRLALGNVARVHRALAIAGPIARVDEVRADPGDLTARATLASGARATFRFRAGPYFQRRTVMRVVTVAGTWEQRNDQVYRDGTPITLVGLGGLFVRDHRAAMARIVHGTDPYVDEGRILHVLDVVDRLSALQCGPLTHRSDAGPLP